MTFERFMSEKELREAPLEGVPLGNANLWDGTVYDVTSDTQSMWKSRKGHHFLDEFVALQRMQASVKGEDLPHPDYFEEATIDEEEAISREAEARERLNSDTGAISKLERLAVLSLEEKSKLMDFLVYGGSSDLEPERYQTIIAETIEYIEDPHDYVPIFEKLEKVTEQNFYIGRVLSEMVIGAIKFKGKEAYDRVLFEVDSIIRESQTSFWGSNESGIRVPRAVFARYDMAGPTEIEDFIAMRLCDVYSAGVEDPLLFNSGDLLDRAFDAVRTGEYKGETLRDQLREYLIGQEDQDLTIFRKEPLVLPGFYLESNGAGKKYRNNGLYSVSSSTYKYSDEALEKLDPDQRKIVALGIGLNNLTSFIANAMDFQTNRATSDQEIKNN